MNLQIIHPPPPSPLLTFSMIIAPDLRVMSNSFHKKIALLIWKELPSPFSSLVNVFMGLCHTWAVFIFSENAISCKIPYRMICSWIRHNTMIKLFWKITRKKTYTFTTQLLSYSEIIEILNTDSEIEKQDWAQLSLSNLLQLCIGHTIVVLFLNDGHR